MKDDKKKMEMSKGMTIEQQGIERLLKRDIQNTKGVMLDMKFFL
jgi:hypothetical protein